MEYVSSKNFKTYLGLADTPETTDPELFREMVKIYGALKSLALSIDIGTGSPIFTVEATEAIGATALVDLYNVAGTLKARNANATDKTKPCKGYAPAAIASGAVGHVVLRGFITISGVTPGAIYYTHTTNGQVVGTKPVGAGNLQQPIGFGLDSTTIYFNPELTGI